MFKYFQSPKIAKKIADDESNNTEHYIVTKTFKETLYKVNPRQFNPEVARLECLKLRLLLFQIKKEWNKVMKYI